MSELISCPNCPCGGPRVGNKGPEDSPFLIIGESPGVQELKQKKPFVGPSGLVLEKALSQVAGVEPYVINAMQCFPGATAKNEELLAAGVSACRERVLAEIAKAPRKVILALGTPALWAVTGDYNLKITQQRGRLLPCAGAEIGVIPSVHPAFLMRGGAGATFQQFMRDVKYAVELCNGLPPKRPPNVKFEVARDERDIRDLARYFRDCDECEYIGADIETSGFSFLSDRILSAGFAPRADEVYVVSEGLIPAIRPIFQNRRKFIWHHGKFDVKFLWQLGVKEARIDEDILLMSYVLDENGGIHDLETVASDWLGSPNWKAMLDSYLPSKKTSYEVIPKDVLHLYMALDIGNTRGLLDVLRPIINADANLKRAYERTLIPAANFLAKVETRGIYVDLERVADNKKWYGEKIEGYRHAFNEIASRFPDSGYTDKLMNSPKQMQRLLYDDLKIKPYKNQRGTGKDIIEKLLPSNPAQKEAIRILQVSRKDNKEYGTYVKNVVENIDIDGSVHTNYLQHGTRTGRLASREPNLQNVPRNPRIRGQYVAKPGRRFLEPDLNQAELRALACFSEDPALCHIYETKGMSLHDELRADIWGYPKDWSPAETLKYLTKFGLKEGEESRITEEQKMRAKAVNFGIVYGREAFSIAEEFQIDPKEAQVWINAWFRKFPVAHKFLETCRAVPARGQVLVNNFGFKRRFGVVGIERLKGMQNEASNFPPQSCASHITLHSGVELEERLADEFDTYVCNLVHDSLLLDCPDDDTIVAAVARLVIAKMEAVPKVWGFTRIPFVAEAKMGYQWGGMKKYKVPELETA